MTDKELVRKRFSGAAGSYDGEAVVQREAARELAALVSSHVPPAFRDRILEIGCGTGLLTAEIAERFSPEMLYLNDICPELESMTSHVANSEFLPGDAEEIPFPENIGLILSGSVLQWFDDPEGFFRKCHSCLRDGGYLAFSTFGPGNLREITGLTGLGLPYPGQGQFRDMLSGKFKVLFTGETSRQMHFRSPGDVLRHLKKTGVNGLGRRSWTRSDLEAFCRRYEENYSVGDGVVLTYCPLYVIARKM